MSRWSALLVLFEVTTFFCARDIITGSMSHLKNDLHLTSDLLNRSVGCRRIIKCPRDTPNRKSRYTLEKRARGMQKARTHAKKNGLFIGNFHIRVKLRKPIIPKLDQRA